MGQQYMTTITAHLQDQYAFIHDALSDYITCGDTSMMAHELRGTIVDMNKKDGTGRSGFEQQFEVRVLILHRNNQKFELISMHSLLYAFVSSHKNYYINIYFGTLPFFSCPVFYDGILFYLAYYYYTLYIFTLIVYVIILSPVHGFCVQTSSW